MSAERRQITIARADGGPRLPLVVGDGEVRAVIWPGMGAELRSMHRISLAPGSRTIDLRHPVDAVYYVMAGDGHAEELGENVGKPLQEGSMVHVDAATPYRISAGSIGLELVGGPAPADPALYGEPSVARRD